ncbi:MAG TPA: hypothetical protein VFA42_01325 [Gaiellaceae bacterium]|nr:hypothetical protein [Gaiellaceae bacterium]
MRRRIRPPYGTLAALTIGLAVALGLRPISVREIVAAYVLALTAVALLVLARTARTEEEWERAASELARALAPRAETRRRPPELVVVERDARLAAASAGDFHSRLRPLLWSIVEARTRAPREALDDDTWELLRPDRPVPADLSAPGVPLRRLAQVVDELEQL